jgi:hypothetical protein
MDAVKRERSWRVGAGVREIKKVKAEFSNGLILEVRQTWRQRLTKYQIPSGGSGAPLDDVVVAQCGTRERRY